MVDGADMPTTPAHALTPADEAREANGRNLGEATLENSGPPELASDDPKVWQMHVTVVLLFYVGVLEPRVADLLQRQC
jgi:hypothetical protein